MNFKSRVQRARWRKGLSRAELAKAVGVSVSAIRNFENGLAYPRPDNLAALANALELDLDALVDLVLSEKEATEATA